MLDMTSKYLTTLRIDQSRISLGVKAQEATMELFTISLPNKDGFSRHSVYSQPSRITRTKGANNYA